MDFTNKLVAKLGSDKLLHMFLAGWITSISALFSITSFIVVSILVVVLSFIKEYYLDDKPDLKDILYAGIGILISAYFYFIA